MSRVTFQADYHHTAIKRAPDVVTHLGQETPRPAHSVPVLRQKAGWTPRPVTGLHSWSKEAPRAQVASIVPSLSWAHSPGLEPCPRGTFLHRAVSGTLLDTPLFLPFPCHSRLRNCCRAGGRGTPGPWNGTVASGCWWGAGRGHEACPLACFPWKSDSLCLQGQLLAARHENALVSQSQRGLPVSQHVCP